MYRTASGESFLLQQFRAFYSEVMRLKRLVQTSGSWVSRSAPPPTEGLDRPGDVNAIRQRVLSLLKQQALDAGHRGGEYGVGLYRDHMQYVMAVLADEIFVHLAWEGREVWKGNLLESELFQSQAAGERFFEKLEQLLQIRDPVYTEVALIYLMALALGFRGKFRDINDGGQIEAYRRQLFAFVFRRHPELLSDSQPFFQEAYSHTFTEGRAPTLPNALKAWSLIGIALLVLWLVASHIAWWHIADGIGDETQSILTLNNAGR
jgi:type VI secretion system protein ImpK